MAILQHFRSNLKHHRTRFIIFLILAFIILRGAASYFGWGWQFAFAMSIGLTLVFWLYAVIMDDDFLKRVLFFAIVAGFTELAADWWLVDITQTLVYFTDEPFIIRSPLYMPFAWCMVLTNIGLLAFLLMNKEPKWVVVLISMLIGCTVIPFFEFLAKFANWWYYEDCKMIFHVPYYIILGEALICSMLGYILHYIDDHRKRKIFLLGVLQGLWIWLSYFIAYNIFEN